MKAEYKFKMLPSTAATRRGQLSVHPDESQLSEDQKKALTAIRRWVNKPTPLLTLGGYAGTGKTSLLSLLSHSYSHKKFAFCAYTGKAAGVLRQRIDVTRGHAENYIGTLHKLMYYPYVNARTGDVVKWCRRSSLGYDFIIIDESSMVDELLYKDIASYNIPILAVGDHGQLPPVRGKFNLMEAPMLKLEQVHRQAADNPILQLSEYIRKEGDLPEEVTSNDHIVYASMRELPNLLSNIYLNDKVDIDDVALLSYYNRTRQNLNRQVRGLRSTTPGNAPVRGDQVICLRNMEDTVFNGMRGFIEEIEPNVKYQTASHNEVAHWHKVKALFPDDDVEFTGPVSSHQFGELKTFESLEDMIQRFGLIPNGWEEVGLLMDYGYALTVHKAQGSEFSCVVLLYERAKQATDDDFCRWLYTGTTRSRDTLVVVFPD